MPEERVINGPFELGDLRITPLPLPHGSMTTTGFLFEQGGKRTACVHERLQGDSRRSYWKQVRGVEVAVLDALRYKPHPTHMCLDEALTAARRINAGRRLSLPT